MFLNILFILQISLKKNNDEIVFVLHERFVLNN